MRTNITLADTLALWRRASQLGFNPSLRYTLSLLPSVASVTSGKAPTKPTAAFRAHHRNSLYLRAAGVLVTVGDRTCDYPLMAITDDADEQLKRITMHDGEKFGAGEADVLRDWREACEVARRRELMTRRNEADNDVYFAKEATRCHAQDPVAQVEVVARRVGAGKGVAL